MEKEIKREAVKQYLKYFRVWFIIVGVLAVACIGAAVSRKMLAAPQSVNSSAPAERVYDYADKLTAEEEELLRRHIARMEEENKIHLVLVTISQDMEGTGSSWENAMMNYADDFYDFNDYGYNKVHGDGALLLDNWYEGQAGSWLSTCGKVEDAFGNYQIDKVLDAVYYKVEKSPYEAYRAYVDSVCSQLAQASHSMTSADYASAWFGIFVMATIIALIYLFSNLHQQKARDTTNSLTYVRQHKPVVLNSRDDFIRKNVTHVRIQTSSSSGGSHHSGGGGHHVSRSGVSHGGGGRRR